jgi:uncharacterized protein YndB with AHSA1/START domain
VPDLHHSVPIDAPASKVYEAIATQEGLRGWWTADSVADSRIGGKAEFGFDGRAMVFRMTIEALEPGRKVRWKCGGDHPEWRGTSLDWEISETGGSSVLSFTHRGWKEMTPFCASCNSTWGELMYRLKDHVEGRKPGPRWVR